MPSLVQAAWLTTLLVLVASAPIHTAVAQQSLSRSEPAADARLSASPHELRLTFHERVEMALTEAEVLDPDGKPVPLAALRLARGAANTVVATLAEVLKPGEYAVIWQVGAPDGHLARGRFGFTVVADTTRVPPTVPRGPRPGIRVSVHGQRGLPAVL